MSAVWPATTTIRGEENWTFLCESPGLSWGGAEALCPSIHTAAGRGGCSSDEPCLADQPSTVTSPLTLPAPAGAGIPMRIAAAMRGRGRRPRPDCGPPNPTLILPPAAALHTQRHTPC